METLEVVHIYILLRKLKDLYEVWSKSNRYFQISIFAVFFSSYFVEQRNGIKFCVSFGCNVIAIHLWFVTSYNLFNIPWAMSMQRCFCLKFCNFGTIFVVARFMPKTSVKIAWHEHERYANIISNLSAFLQPVIPQLNLCSTLSRTFLFFIFYTCDCDKDLNKWNF